jgi:chemotaxis protein histidine kinase CheA
MSKKKQPIEVFMPPNILKAKVGGSGGLDINAIKRAEQAMEELKSEFTNWIVEDVNRLASTRGAYEARRSRVTLATLYRAAHDLKGQGTTFDFPLISRVAASLCRLTDEGTEANRIPMTLIDAHVDAIKIIVRDDIKDPSNAMASILAGELEAKVAAFLEKASAA